MKFERIEIPNNFIYDISIVPGSSDEICQKAIEHYQNIASIESLDPKLKEICNGIINVLTEYYSMSCFESENLQNILPHLSEVANFMQNQSSRDAEVKSMGRIKSFYSVYVKIIDKAIQCIEKSKPIPQKGFLGDIWATRDVLYPFYDMRFEPEAFYKKTYAKIIAYMEYLDNLSQENPKYALTELDQNKLLDLQRPKIYTYPSNQPIDIPKKDFLGYGLEIYKLEEGFIYLPENATIEDIRKLIEVIQNSSDDELINNNSPLIRSIINSAKFEQLVQYRNSFERKLLDLLSQKSTFDDEGKRVSWLSRYEKLNFDDFYEECSSKFSTYEKDSFKFLNYLNEVIKFNGNYSNVNSSKYENLEFVNSLARIYSQFETSLISERLNSIREIKIDESLEDKYQKASKLKRFSRCGKDYMKYPKPSGYQSYHLIVQTPFGSYEKQIRTEKQDDFAERGPASHKNSYKPDVRSSFHRLKVPTILVAKRDENGDIIEPFQFTIPKFEQAIQYYYNQPFANFSGGKSISDLHAEYPNKEDFDKALLALSPPKEKESFIKKLWNKIFSRHKKKPEKPTFSTDDNDPHDNR